MIGQLGAINIPFYEEMARKIHWWQYSGCRMISFTPWYIILGEFGIALAFAFARANTATWFVAPGCYRWNSRWIIDLCLLRRGVLGYGSIGRVKRFVTPASMRVVGAREG